MKDIFYRFSGVSLFSCVGVLAALFLFFAVPADAARIKKKKTVEDGYLSAGQSFFNVKYEGASKAGLANKVMRVLNDAYYKVGSEFNLYPGTQLEVVIFSEEAFKKSTRLPSWAAGVYDGKIKIMEKDIGKGDRTLRRLLFHEYTHSLLRKILDGAAIPLWLDEGLAQYQEDGGNTLTAEEKHILKVLAEKKRLRPFSRLSSPVSFMAGGRMASQFYLQAKAFVIYLIDRYGSMSLSLLIDNYKKLPDPESAVSATYIKDITQLENDWKSVILKSR